MSKSPRYDDDRRIELWTRQLDGQALNEAEAADLVRALIDDTELRGVLDGDDRIHGLLRASASLVKPKGDSRQSRATPHDDGEQFVAEVLARLDRVLPQEVIPLPPVSVAPVSIASSSFDNASVPPMNGPPADAAGVVPIQRIHARRNSRSSAPRFRGWTAGWIAAAALVGIFVIGAVIAMQWSNKGGARPADSTVATDSTGSSTVTPDARREQESTPSPRKPDGRASPNERIAERGSETVGRGNWEANSPERPAASGVDVRPVVWRTGGPSGGRLLPGVHELAHGRARVRTADDLELDVAAPAMLELRDPRSVDVRRGVVRVHHPDLRVTTPLTELRSLDGDAEFRVAEAGETEILIHDGELTFADRLSSGSAAQPITLQAGRLDHARLTAPLATTPTSTPSGPRGDAGRVAVAELTGPDAQFRGVINVDGRVLEFNSPAAFEAARRQTFSQFQRSPEEFIQRWKQMVQEMNSRFGSDGSFIELNGRRLEPRSGDAAFGFQFSSQSSSSSGTGANESFRGSININGRQHTFNSRAEFEAAQRELLKPTTKP